MRRLFIVAASIAALVGATASGAFAGEVKGLRARRAARVLTIRIRAFTTQMRLERWITQTRTVLPAG